MRSYPPVELQAGAAALDVLRGGISGWAIDRAGSGVSAIWLRGEDAGIWALGVAQRELEAKFEVFTLAMESLESVQRRIASWEPPALPAGMPEGLRDLLSARPPIPEGPREFDPWPFRAWQAQVLRREEFIVEDVEAGPTFGSNPNAQDAARPGHVPPEASAACIVAAGLLFTGEHGERLLIGVDWMPMNMILVRQPEEIEAYASVCDAIALADYISSGPPAD